MDNITLSEFPFLCRVFTYLLGDKDSLFTWTEKERSAENRVSVDLLSDVTKSRSYEIRIGMKLKNFKLIKSQVLMEDFFYILKTLSILNPELYSYNFEAYKDYLIPRQFELNRPWCFSNTEVVSNKYFLEYYENLLSDDRYRMSLIRRMKDVRKCRDGKLRSNIEIFTNEVLIFAAYRIKKNKPKRLIRHKGYRDHGSLRPSSLPAELNENVLTEKEYVKLLGEKEELQAWNLSHYNPLKK